MKNSPIEDPLERLAPGQPVGVVSRGLTATPHLPLLVGRPVHALRADALVAGLLTWGVRRLGWRAEARARRENLPVIRIEDPFYRSVGLGKEGAPTLGLSVDDVGIYYDARSPSRLENILASHGWETPRLLAEAAALMARVAAERVTKYNIGADQPAGAAAGRIVLVDQVLGDRSIAGAGADHATFMRMIRTAIKAFPAKRLAVRVHPDVARGHARGYLLEDAHAHRLRVISDDVSPHALLDEAVEIWTVSSQLGFEALLRGVKVTTFGMPFYAGWGLTRDEAMGDVAESARARRGVVRRVDELFAASVLLYARWVDPIRHEACDFARVLDRLADWRARDRERAGPPIVAFGFTPWKQARAGALIGGASTPVTFARGWKSPRPGEPLRVCVWGRRDKPGFEDKCRRNGHVFSRVEDGFIRSVGLGAGLTAAGSLVLDDAGLYYDATRPSALEALIATHPFDDALRARAVALRERITSMGVTKYNLGETALDPRAQAGGRRVVLVIGQVPGDQATRLGAGAFSDTLSLVRAARASKPDAFLVFKDHPDVVAGHRRGHGRAAEIAALVDLVVDQGDAASLAGRIDEMHVLSSLAGFEALLRGVPVTCWGRPFYAGWGLTTDMAEMPRRGRRISLDELVAASLILYPRYAEPLTGLPVTPEDYLTALANAPRLPARAKPLTHRLFLALRREVFRRFPAG